MEYNNFKTDVDNHNTYNHIEENNTKNHTVVQPSNEEKLSDTPESVFEFDKLDQQDLLKGILLSEILGKPVSKRRNKVL